MTAQEVVERASCAGLLFQVHGGGMQIRGGTPGALRSWMPWIQAYWREIVALLAGGALHEPCAGCDGAGAGVCWSCIFGNQPRKGHHVV